MDLREHDLYNMMARGGCYDPDVDEKFKILTKALIRANKRIDLLAKKVRKLEKPSRRRPPPTSIPSAGRIIKYP